MHEGDAMNGGPQKSNVTRFVLIVRVLNGTCNPFRNVLHADAYSAGPDIIVHPFEDVPHGRTKLTAGLASRRICRYS